jgi:hypothetical protein
MDVQDKVSSSGIYALIEEKQVHDSERVLYQALFISRVLLLLVKKYQSIEDMSNNEILGGFKLLQIQNAPVDSPTTLFAEYKGLKIYGPVTATFLKDLIS